MKWYMTVGYPGGEFAAQNPHLLEHEVQEIQRSAGARNIAIRPCPPDLVAWIESPRKGNLWEPSEMGRMYAAPGGWLVCNYEINACVFDPVAGAAGLTINNTEEK